MYEKLEKKAPARINNHDLLGHSMIEAGSDFGPGTAYGEGVYDVDELSPCLFYWKIKIKHKKLLEKVTDKIRIL